MYINLIKQHMEGKNMAMDGEVPFPPENVRTGASEHGIQECASVPQSRAPCGGNPLCGVSCTQEKYKHEEQPMCAATTRCSCGGYVLRGLPFHPSSPQVANSGEGGTHHAACIQVWTWHLLCRMRISSVPWRWERGEERERGRVRNSSLTKPQF